jgi:hypothetical protein
MKSLAAHSIKKLKVLLFTLCLLSQTLGFPLLAAGPAADRGRPHTSCERNQSDKNAF